MELERLVKTQEVSWKMKYIIAVDDTDDLTKETSTGLISGLISKRLKKDFNARINKGITRHQLLLAKGVPYTSHNSAMAFEVDGEMNINEIFHISEEIIRANMAKSSCPGLCVLLVDGFKNQNELIAYGLKTKREIIEKEEAISLIEKNAAFLLGKELGGNGQGIIGALAGVGLRLYGSDGTFRGKVQIPEELDHISAGEFKKIFFAEAVLDGKTKKKLDDSEEIFCEDFAKLFYIDNKKVALVIEQEGKYVVCNREKAFKIEDEILKSNSFCPKFILDNDINECIDSQKSCSNCLYRRLTKDGFVCSLV